VKEKKHRLILKAISYLILAVFLFNAGVYIGRSLSNGQVSLNNQPNQEQPRDYEQNLDEPYGVMDDQTFFEAMSESFKDQARVEMHQEYDGVFVIPTSQDFIDAINYSFSANDNYQQWNYIVQSFLDMSTYSTLNVYLINPFNEELMLLWVCQNEIVYNFASDQDFNPDDTQIISKYSGVEIG